ncbi:MAG: hypothetical protein ACYDBB_24215 [Armatimonadota bacterium]
MRNGVLLAMSCLVLLLVVGAWGQEVSDPRLKELSARLTAILERGGVGVLTLEAAKREALGNADYGIRADYRAWITNVRDYSKQLTTLHAYRDVPLVAKLAGDPINAPWQLDDAARRLLDGKPGVETGVAQGGRAWCTIAGMDTLPGLHSRARGHTATDCMTYSLTEAARLVDKNALGTVTPEQRTLLRFVIPWICRSGGQFANGSKGSPYYGMEMQFQPNDGFTAGDALTRLAKTPIPPEINSVTALTRYLHALAGMPVTDPMPFLKETGEFPQFTCQVDMWAMGKAYAVLQSALTSKALDQLKAELIHDEHLKIVQPTEPGVTGTLIGVIDTLYGKVLFGGSGANRYEDVDALAIFDLGGNDDYVYTKPETQIGRRGVQVIVDYAGDDLYQTQGVGGPGAGLLGISILIDRAGNDRYCQGLSPLLQPRTATRATLVQPDPEGVQTNLVPFPLLWGNAEKPAEKGVALDAGFAFGAGFLGIGVLVDEGGDDCYLGQKFAFGCGFWRGAGVLHDAGGHDVYAAGLAAIGAGINGGIGLLDDRAGDDHYQCLGTFESAYSAGQEWDNGYMGSGIGFGSSWRAEARGENPLRKPTLGGGIGLAHDAAGNDSYLGASFGVAASYAGGIGALIDETGNDTYFVKRGPNGDNRSGWSGNHALGNGCHRGIGYLLDRAGNDRYSASGLGGGTAWDIASGFLLDLGGDDAMTDLHGKGLQGNTGWGAAKGFAVSYHVGGTDVYQRSTLGDAASIGDGYPGLGGNFSFFFDLGPEQDTYPAPLTNNTATPSAVSVKKETDGKEYPQGIGVFVDGVPPARP